MNNQINSAYDIEFSQTEVGFSPDLIQSGGDFSMLIDSDQPGPTANIAAVQKSNAISIKNRSSDYFVKITQNITDKGGNTFNFSFLIWPEGTEDSNYSSDVINSIKAEIIGDETAYSTKIKNASGQVISANSIPAISGSALGALSASALINVRFHSE